jgi:hypothetical protein
VQEFEPTMSNTEQTMSSGGASWSKVELLLSRAQIQDPEFGSSYIIRGCSVDLLIRLFSQY